MSCLLVALQDGGCEHGDMGGAIQQFCAGTVLTQLEILPIWLHGRLLHCTLPVSSADDLLVGQIGKGSSPMLQL